MYWRSSFIRIDFLFATHMGPNSCQSYDPEKVQTLAPDKPPLQPSTAEIHHIQIYFYNFFQFRSFVHTFHI